MMHEKQLLHCPAVSVGTGRPIVFALRYIVILWHAPNHCAKISPNSAGLLVNRPSSSAGSASCDAA